MNDHLSDASIYEYLDDALQKPERARVTAHLSQCEACANRLTQARALFQALDELPDVELQRDLAPGVLETINAARFETRGASKTMRWVFLGQLLVALVILAARGGNLRAWQAVPWYALTAGLFGLVIVGTIGYTVPRLGLSTAFTIIVAAQFGCCTMKLLISMIVTFGLHWSFFKSSIQLKNRSPTV